jgi:hypothetical protein
VKIYFDWERAMFATPVFAGNSPGGRAAFRTANDLFWVRFQYYF